jgi:hypothetical protein
MACTPLYAQNAQQFYFNRLAFEYDYEAASFVVDTPPLASSSRAFLLWSKNFTNNLGTRSLSLDEFDQTGNFISSQYSRQSGASTANLHPKKIIKAQHAKGYYLLAYVFASNNPIGGYYTFSTPLIIRLDEHLNPVWVNRIHYATIDLSKSQSLIEYNDIIEASNGDIILAGRFSTFSDGQRCVLLTRLNQAGNLLWSLQYDLNDCNAQALSVAEASSGNIVITGEIEECISGSFTGPKRLLHAAFNSIGTPLIVRKYQNGSEMAGNKIVRHTNTPNNDSFFVAGYVDIKDATGQPNRQILLMDIREGGGIVSVHQIGDSETEVANDILFKNLGSNQYALYLTGHTNSYYQNYQTSDAFYLQLKYNNGTLSLDEFSTFPKLNTSYQDRAGLEIQQAGNSRFAILGTAKYFFYSPQPQNRVHTNVFIRDLSDTSGSCVTFHQPPVGTFPVGWSSVNCSPFRWPFAIYPGVFERYDSTINTQTDCGRFFIDPYPASDTAAQLQAITRSKEAAVKVRVYPNPVTNELYIDYGHTGVEGKVMARIYSTDQRLVGEYLLPGGYRNSIPLQGLSSGLYFLQLLDKSSTQVFKIMKD